MNFFTDARREIIAKTILDTVKLLVPIMLATDLFSKYNMFVRGIVLGAIPCLFAGGVWVFPPKNERSL